MADRCDWCNGPTDGEEMIVMSRLTIHWTCAYDLRDEMADVLPTARTGRQGGGNG